jgi:hypothetical protein
VVGSMGLAGSSAYQWGVHLTKFSHWLPHGRPGPRRIAPTANLCIERPLWERFGPFEESSFSGDTLFSWKAARAGLRAWFEPRAVVTHQHGGTVRSFLIERVARGEDLAVVRTGFEDWSRSRDIFYLLAFPARPLVMWLRAGLDAVRSGHSTHFLTSTPLVFMGWVAWFLGEAKVHARLAAGRPASPLGSRREPRPPAASPPEPDLQDRGPRPTPGQRAGPAGTGRIPIPRHARRRPPPP